MNEKEFVAFIESCDDELNWKQDALMERYELDSFEEYAWDQETMRLEFRAKGQVVHEFPVCFIGTWAYERDDWLWGWANETFSPVVRAATASLKELEKKTGNRTFTLEHVHADEEMVSELVAVAAHELDALGIFMDPGDESHLFLALMPPKQV